jgi:hypothetical protein
LLLNDLKTKKATAAISATKTTTINILIAQVRNPIKAISDPMNAIMLLKNAMTIAISAKTLPHLAVEINHIGIRTPFLTSTIAT